MDHVSQVWSWKEFDLLLLTLFLNFRLSREVYFNPGYPSFKVYVEINGFPRQQALWFYRVPKYCFIPLPLSPNLNTRDWIHEWSLEESFKGYILTKAEPLTTSFPLKFANFGVVLNSICSLPLIESKKKRVCFFGMCRLRFRRFKETMI